MKLLSCENNLRQHSPRPAEHEGTEEGYTQIRSSSCVLPNNHQASTKLSASHSHWTLKSVTVLNISLILLLALLPQDAAGACSLQRSIHTVRFRRCVPKRVLSYNCRGTCNSFSSLDNTDLNSIIRNCNCCKETGFRRARIPLRCPKPSGERGYRDAHVRVKIPTGCSCRPCDPVPTIQAGEFL